MLEIKKYYPALHGAATDKLALLCGQKGETDIFTGRRTVTGEGLTLEPGQETFHVSTHKLLSSAVIVFTRDTANTAVAFTLREYAELLGIGSSRTGLDNLRRTVQRDLKILSELSLSWQETIGGKAESFKDIRLFKSCSLHWGALSFTFSKRFADYLVSRPLTQFPRALFTVDERSRSCYTIGLKLALHAANKGIIAKGTAGSLKVSTLLKWSSLPDIDTVRRRGKSYNEKLRSPFEQALIELKKCGLLTGFGYRDPPSEPCSYSVWSELTVDFDIPGFR